MSIIDDCRDMYGTLSSSNRALLQAMLDGADCDTWQRARRIVISPLPAITLHMAVRAVTSLLNQENVLDSAPDAFTVHRALRYAIRRREEYYNTPFEPGLEAYEP